MEKGMIIMTKRTTAKSLHEGNWADDLSEPTLMNRATTGALVLAKGCSFMVPRKLTAADLYDDLPPEASLELDTFLSQRSWWSHFLYRFQITIGFFSQVEWRIFLKTIDNRYQHLRRFLGSRPASFD